MNSSPEYAASVVSVTEQPSRPRVPFLVKLCLFYNKLFRFRARWDWLIRERMEAEARRKVDPLQEDLRYAGMEYTKAAEFLQRFGTVTLTGKRVLDFGCCFGGSTLWYAQQGAAQVYGVDLSAEALEIARLFVAQQTSGNGALNERLHFLEGGVHTIPLADEAVDLIVSEDVVEHLEAPESILDEWWRVLVPGGQVLLSFGPLWYHPHGVHLWEIFPAPWTHLLFPESTCVWARNYLKDDGKNGSHWTELNKMTMARFERLIKRSRFRPLKLQSHALWNLKPLARLPGLRELFISQVDCILEKR
jgi:SAM-dependent methyltransferase